MPIITATLPSDGDDAVVEPYNAAIIAILGLLNGALDSDNIASLSGTKILAGTLPSSSFDSSGAAGWTTLPNTLVYGSNTGNHEQTLTASGVDLTSRLSTGMKLQVTRSTIPPTQSMGFTAASSQYATKSSPANVSFTGPFTCESWIYLKSYTGSSQFIINCEDGTQGWGMYLTASGQLNVYFGAGSSFTNFVSTQSVSLNRWTHVAGAVTSPSAKTAVLYIDGLAVPFTAFGTATTLVQPTADLRIAAYSHTASGYFDGYIFGVRVWSVAQNQASIQGNMGINLTGSELNLVTLIPGNGVWTDLTTNANTVSPINSAINTQASNPYNPIERAFVTKVVYSGGNSTVSVKSISGIIPNMTLTTPQYSTVDCPLNWPSTSTSLFGHKLLELPFLASQTTTSTSAVPFGGSSSSTYWPFTVPSTCSRLKIKVYNTSFCSGSSSATTVLLVNNGSTILTQTNQTSANAYMSTEMVVAVVPGSVINFNLAFYTTSGTSTWGSFAGSEQQGVSVEVA